MQDSNLCSSFIHTAPLLAISPSLLFCSFPLFATATLHYDTKYHVISSLFAGPQLSEVWPSCLNQLKGQTNFIMTAHAPYSYPFDIRNLRQDLSGHGKIIFIFCSHLRPCPLLKKHTFILSESDFTNWPLSEGVWFYSHSQGPSPSWTERIQSEFYTDP
jgi:hypothetical protein